MMKKTKQPKKNIMLDGKRKFFLATLSLVMAFILTLTGNMTGNEFFLTIGLVLSIYVAGNYGEHKLKNGGSHVINNINGSKK